MGRGSPLAIVSMATRREAGLLEIAGDQRRVVVAVRRAHHHAGRVVRKERGKGVRDVIGEDVLLDAIPDVEEEMPARAEDAPRLAVAGDAVGEEHRAELAEDEIEARVVERQRQGIGLTPVDGLAGRLLRGRHGRASAG